MVPQQFEVGNVGEPQEQREGSALFCPEVIDAIG